MKLRQTIIILTFSFIVIAVIIFSLLIPFNLDQKIEKTQTNPRKENDQRGMESYFKEVHYFLTKNGQPKLSLKSATLEMINGNTEIISSFPDGVMYRNKNLKMIEHPLFFSAVQGRANKNTGELFFKENVKVRMDQTETFAEKIEISNNGNTIKAEENVKTFSIDSKTFDQILVSAKSALFLPKEGRYEYVGSVNGQIKRKRKYEEGVHFSADFLTALMQINQLELKGNVELSKDRLVARANKGLVFLENYNKKLKYYALSDDVKLQETLILDGQEIVRKAFAEKLEGMMGERKIILTGLPKVFQGKDAIRGNRITIRENIETVEVDDANTNIILKNENTIGN